LPSEEVKKSAVGMFPNIFVPPLEFAGFKYGNVPHRRTSVNVFSEEKRVHSRPREVAQQSGDTRLHQPYVELVPDSRLHRNRGDARLIRVEFPWMAVKNAARTRNSISSSNAPAGNRIGQQAKISAPSAGSVFVEHLYCSYWNF